MMIWKIVGISDVSVLYVEYIDLILKSLKHDLILTCCVDIVKNINRSFLSAINTWHHYTSKEDKIIPISKSYKPNAYKMEKLPK